MKNKFRYAIGACILAAAGGFYFSQQAQVPEPTAASIPEPELTSKGLSEQVPRSMASANDVSVNPSSVEVVSKPDAAVPEPNSVPGIPDLELDERWRKANGFPADPFYKSYLKLSASELKALALTDPIAKVLHTGSLMSDPIQRETGKRILMEMAADGSIFALHELAFRSGTGQPGGSAEKQFAYWQSALAMGDIGMMPTLTQSAGQMSRDQYALSQMMFADVMYQLGLISSNRHGRGLIPNLRPIQSPPTPPSKGN
jgi:hypothetical protein